MQVLLRACFSGLDSFTALNVIIHLKSLSMLKNKTIVCSVHQPSAQIFGLFHQIILLCQGKIAFSGTSEEAVAFFEKLVGVHNVRAVKIHHNTFILPV